MDVRWITAFVDRPGDAGFAATVDFWSQVSGSSLSPWRGDHDEFATLVPDDGADPHLRVQRTQTTDAAGSHLDLHVPDVRAGAAECVELGASVTADHGGYVVLVTPGGMPFCVVRHQGERRRQAPVAVGGAPVDTLLDQVCVDADPDRFADEVRFWSGVTGWSPLPARAPEFVPLDRPSTMPLRVLLQRRDAPSGRTSCHLDFACDDVVAATAAHEALGASSVSPHRHWTVMADPSGAEYCLTGRRPATGVRAPEG